MKRLVLIGFLLLGVVASSYNSEKRSSDVPEIDVGNPQDEFSKRADSLVFSLEHINTVIDEKCK